MHKQAMQVISSNESWARDLAMKVAHATQHPGFYGLHDQEEVLGKLKGRSWLTADGSTRRLSVEPELLGDIGWPTTIVAVKVTIVYQRDGSSINYRYSLSDLI